MSLRLVRTGHSLPAAPPAGLSCKHQMPLKHYIKNPETLGTMGGPTLKRLLHRCFKRLEELGECEPAAAKK